MTEELKAPFPYFGGKSTIADIVWQHLGNPDNFIEPFFGSGAVLLLRPGPPKIETANDVNTYLSNFWRSTQYDPEGVAEYADWPVSEVDMHARHKYLVLSDDAREFREKMRADHDYYNVKFAGYWVNGICAWIGAGWCVEPGEDSHGPHGGSGERLPYLSRPGADLAGKGVRVEGQHGPIGGSGKRKINVDNQGVHNGLGSVGKHGPVGGSGERRARLNAGHGPGNGINAGRPQLADAYSRGRGVNGNDQAGTCAERRAWLLDWFCRLRDRFRTVRVCCGDWTRVCSSPSVLTRLGTTGVFLDPPYSAKANRSKSLYATDSMTVANDVRAWCLKWGSNKLMRIVLCGYEGEGHEELEKHGWKVHAWTAQGGYGNKNKKGNKNKTRERLWISPHCIFERGLFD